MSSNRLASFLNLLTREISRKEIKAKMPKKQHQKGQKRKSPPPQRPIVVDSSDEEQIIPKVSNKS